MKKTLNRIIADSSLAWNNTLTNQKEKFVTNANSYIKNLNWDNISDKIINIYKNTLNNKEISHH